MELELGDIANIIRSKEISKLFTKQKFRIKNYEQKKVQITYLTIQQIQRNKLHILHSIEENVNLFYVF